MTNPMTDPVTDLMTGPLTAQLWLMSWYQSSSWIKVKMFKWCRKKWNEYNLMYVYLSRTMWNHKETSQKLWNCPNSRYSRIVKFVKFGQSHIILVWTHAFSKIAIWVCSLNVFKNPSLGVFSKCICHRHCLCLCHCLFVGQSSPLITLVKYLNGHKSLGSLLKGVL